MTNAQKITKALEVFLREGYTDPVYVYETLRRYAMIERDSFDTQYYFDAFYLSFTYYRYEYSSMSLYTNRYSSECPMIAFERDGNILIGKAVDHINIYNGCSPSVQDMETVGLELPTFQYLEEIQTMVKPILATIARNYLK